MIYDGFFCDISAKTLRLCGVLLLLMSPALAQKPSCSLVPGWTQAGPPRAYEADNLFEYMDGNAEGYLIYRFVRMNGVNCQSGADTIVFDVSEMADPESAYGMYTANRDPRRPFTKLGMGGQIGPRKAVFAKGKYYVEVSISSEKPETLRAFATAIEKQISGRTDVPEMISWFPKEKLAPESVRLVPESVLGMRLLRRGYIAQYEAGKAFLVPEESPDSAAGVMKKLAARIGDVKPVSVGDEAFQANDKYLGRLCFFRKGRYLGGFANLPENGDAAGLAAKLAASIR